MASPADRPLRIGMLVPYDLAPHAGGVRQHAFHLKAALERGGDEVHLIGPTSARRGTEAAAERIYALQGVVTVPVNGTQSAVGMLVSPRALLRLCRRLELDVLHLHEPQVPTMAWSLCWWLRGVPKVATFHAADENNSIRWLRQISGNMVYRGIDRGITVSRAAERRTRQTWRRPLTLIPNGVCIDTFAAPAKAEPSQASNHFLFVGALGDQRKGAKVMLEAFARAQRAGLVGRLTMVGAQRGFSLPARPHQVEFREGLSNEALAACYRAADALVAPAIGRESFGMILLEAMASSRPIIASRIAGYQEVAHREGTLFVPPNDAEALASSLLAFGALPAAERRAMGAVNAEHAKGYAWERVARAIRAEYVAAIVERTAGASPVAGQPAAPEGLGASEGAPRLKTRLKPKLAARLFWPGGDAWAGPGPQSSAFPRPPGAS